MQIIITLIAFIFLITITVSIHEFGHFIFAKKFGVYVHEFSIGMGPRLFQKQKGETEYSLRALPIGGYVSMAGEDVNSNIEKDKLVVENRKFYNLKYWKKIIILVAGVTMNFILGILIFSLILGCIGTYYSPASSTIESIVENSPAEQVGLTNGDRIIEIIDTHGKSIKIKELYDIQLTTLMNNGQTLTFIIDRNGERIPLRITPKYDENTESYVIGVICENLEEVKITWYNCVFYGIRYSFDLISQILKGFKLLIKPGGLKLMSGPLGIASLAGEAIQNGILPYLSLMALLNINLGIVNIIPLPVLDGGQILFETIEIITKRKINPKIKYILQGICWIFLLVLMLYIAYNDGLRIFS